MQVSQSKDHITHAVIGGGDTIEFGMSNSAEFFHVMSSTLYKNQILAVVRETLCNAWDAHIEAGVTHIPVELTLTEDKFVIRDRGTGIHRDDIGPIYGVYGNSTKKNDGKQTGGFGLGCKAPFAYTDHFEVISDHDGVRTIYTMSKSSAERQGKPGITPIASFPTTENGLQVSINILNREDWRKFNALIRQIVRNGDMNMTMNGEPMAKLGFDVNKANYVVTTGDLVENQTPIMVRYGNVIYPVDSVAEFREQYDYIEQHLKRLSSHRHDSYNIVFQAPPHSITVQPSREGLSMQEYTIKTMKSLMIGFVKTIAGEFTAACNDVAEAIVVEAVKEARVGDLLLPEGKLPIKPSNSVYQPDISDLGTMAKKYMEHNYPSSLEFRKQDIRFRLEEMVRGGLLERGLVQTYLRHLDGVQSLHRMNRESNSWLQRNVLGRLMAKLAKAGIDTDRLSVYDPNDQHAPRSYYSDQPPMVEARRASPAHLFNALPYLRNIVVISTSKHNLKDRMFRHQVFQELGKFPGFLFYQTSMKKAEREAVMAFFKATNMVVVDLTVKQDWELAEIARRPVPVVAPKKPVKKGLPILSGMKRDSRSGILTTLTRTDNAPRIENPEFVVAVSFDRESSSNSLPNWDSEQSSNIVDLFGAKGGVTNNKAIHRRWIDKGVKDFNPYVYEKLAEFMLTNVNVQEYWAFNPLRAIEKAGMGRYGDNTELVRVIYRAKELRDMFGLKNNLTDEEKKYVKIWNYMLNNRRHAGLPDYVQKAMTHLNAIPLDPANTLLLDKFKDNHLLDVIDGSGLVKLLKEAQPGDKKADAAKQILLLAINN